MRKDLFAVLAVFAVVIGILTPTQSFSAPIASPGKTAGNGPCVTSGSTNSQTQSIKNTNKTCSYSIGDRGPGGGIVFYISANTFTSIGSTCNTACKYLEVAPATWQSAGSAVANDTGYVWSSDTTALTGQVLTTASPVESGFIGENENWKIGQGFNNTRIMKVTSATSAAQAAVLAYAGTDASAGQWFIPSMNELNELCKYARGQTTGDLTVACDNSGTFKSGTLNDLGGFVEVNYWSSSEYGASGAWLQGFLNGAQFAGFKWPNPEYVRPIRAF